MPRKNTREWVENILHSTGDLTELDNLDFEGLYLARLDFSYCNLQGANFEGANLKDAIFYKANLENANLKNAKITRADFTDANLENAILPEDFAK